MYAKVTMQQPSDAAALWMHQMNHECKGKNLLSAEEACWVIRDWAKANLRFAGYTQISMQNDGTAFLQLPGALPLTGCPIPFTELTKQEAIDQGYLPAQETPLSA